MKILRLNGPITEEMIEDLNSSAPILLELKNTVGLSSYILSLLSPDIQIRLYGAQDEKQNAKYGTSEVFENTTYSKEELSSVISVLEEIEKNVQPNWTSLEKALYTYVTLESLLGYRDDKEYSNRPEYNGIYSLVKGAGTSKGIAALYKEAMDRQDVPCRYLSRGNSNAWNEVRINGVYYPLDLSMDVIYHNDVKSEGMLGICNFATDEAFYDNPNHFINGDKRKSSTLSREEVEKAAAIIADRPNNQTIEVRQTPTIRVKSKAFKEVASGNEVTREVAEKVEDVKITLDASASTEELKSDIREIGKFYPELLRNIELENETWTSGQMQEVIDEIFDARKGIAGTTEASKGFTITISSSNVDDFNLDFSNAPEARMDDNAPSEGRKKQRIVLRNTSSGAIHTPDLRSKLSRGIQEIELDGFDLSGFTLGEDSAIEKMIVSGQYTVNLDDIDPSAVTPKFEIGSGIPQAEFDDFMRNIYPTATQIYRLEIRDQNLHDRKIMQELAVNPNLAELIIRNSRLNDLDGLELFRWR